jgi:P-type Cu+ transporter
VDGQHVAVGSHEWVSRCPTPAPAPPASAAVTTTPPPPAGATRVHVAVDGAIVGHIDLLDAIRPGAAATVAHLQQWGIRTVMLTGDEAGAAAAVGTALGFAEKDVFSGVNPQGKLEKVEELCAAGASVAMVGDGINDTAALAAADVGIAMAGGVQV